MQCDYMATWKYWVCRTSNSDKGKKVKAASINFGEIIVRGHCQKAKSEIEQPNKEAKKAQKERRRVQCEQKTKKEANLASPGRISRGRFAEVFDRAVLAALTRGYRRLDPFSFYGCRRALPLRWLVSWRYNLSYTRRIPSSSGMPLQYTAESSWRACHYDLLFFTLIFEPYLPTIVILYTLALFCNISSYHSLFFSHRKTMICCVKYFIGPKIYFFL